MAINKGHRRCKHDLGGEKSLQFYQAVRTRIFKFCSLSQAHFLNHSATLLLLTPLTPPQLKFSSSGTLKINSAQTLGSDVALHEYLNLNTVKMNQQSHKKERCFIVLGLQSCFHFLTYTSLFQCGHLQCFLRRKGRDSRKLLGVEF